MTGAYRLAMARIDASAGRWLVGLALASALGGCTQDSSRPSTAAPTSSATPGAVPSQERTGEIKAPPTVRLKETDEFGIVVKAERRNGALWISVDRVDSLTGRQAEQAAAARGMDYANDHFEVNDNPRTRDYVLAKNVQIWLANPSDVASPKPLRVSEWLGYLARTRDSERRPMFHLDVEGGHVVGVEEQYFP